MQLKLRKHSDLLPSPSQLYRAMPRQQFLHRPRSQASALQQTVGNAASKVSMGWRRTGGTQIPNQQRDREHNSDPRDPRGPMLGSKILMSQLPPETVHERDIEELFAETIGPVFEVFIIYNSLGRSKGMAVVNFQRRGDAAEARRKYNGKIIDGRRPLKIELIIDPPEGPARDMSLMARLGGQIANGNMAGNYVPTSPFGSFQRARPLIYRRGLKKGPRRPKKSLEQLDHEVDAYMAEAPRITETDVKTAVGSGSTVVLS